MAGPVASYVRLGDDSGYTGSSLRKPRTQTRVVGVDTVHEHDYLHPVSKRVVGLFEAGLATQTVSATVQNGTSTGFLWAHMPSAVTGRSARVRWASMTSNESAAFVSPTAPRVAVSRFTFTGTATGAGVNYARDAYDEVARLDLRTAVTGLTVSLVATMATFGIVGALTAVAAYTPSRIAGVDWLNGPGSPEDEWITIAPGEGLVFWQDVAGTTSDSRKLNIFLAWDEIDTN